jgi:UDP-N-acetyl-D-galactosamine dehydrogenase
VIDVIRELQDFGCDVEVSDYWADKEEVQREYNLNLSENVNFDTYEAVILAVAHDDYRDLDLTPNNKRVVFDIKSMLQNSDGCL